MNLNNFIKRFQTIGKAHEEINEVYHDWLEDIVNDPKRAEYPIIALMPAGTRRGKTSEEFKSIKLTFYILQKKGASEELRDSIWSDLTDWSDKILESIESPLEDIELQSADTWNDEFAFPDLATSIKVEAIFKYSKY